METQGTAETVLGLSMTSDSIAWVLLDGPSAEAATLDHDHFDIVADAAADGDITRHQSAVRCAQTIAEADGHRITSIAVTWTDDVDAKAALLLKSLPDMGFDTVIGVPLPEAARLWVKGFGRALGVDRCAVCVVESAAVSVASVLYDTARSARSQMRESADGIGRWLRETFETLRAQPESVYLLGSRGDLELIAGPLESELTIPVVASDEAQLTLARGAALKLAAAAEPAAAVDQVTRPVRHRPRRRAVPSRIRSHARPVAALAAVVIGLLVVVPELVGPSESTPQRRPAVTTSDASAASNSSATSVSVHAVPAPAPVVQPLAAQPAPAPPPEAEPAAVPVEEPVETAVEAGPELAVVSDEITEEPTAEPVAAAVVDQPVVEAQPAAFAPAEAPPAPDAPRPMVAAPATLAPNPLAPPDPIAAALSPIFGGLP